MRPVLRNMSPPLLLGSALSFWIGATADAAVACPFCASGASGTGGTYLIATIVMLVLPLGLLGGFALWVRRSLRSREGGRGTDAPLRGHAPPRTGRRDG